MVQKFIPAYKMEESDDDNQSITYENTEDSEDIDEKIHEFQEKIYNFLNKSDEINIRKCLDYILKIKNINIMYKKDNILNIDDPELLNFVNFHFGNNEDIYKLLLSIVTLLCLGKQEGNNYNFEIKFYMDLYDGLIKNKKIINDLFNFENIDNNKLENDDKYYDILFKLDKKERIKLLCKDIEKEFKERKFQRKIEKNKYETSLKIYKKVLKNKCNKEIKIIKDRSKKFIDEMDLFIKDFDIFYNNNLINCKNKGCNILCGNDIGYCLTHLPKHCEKCNKIIESNGYDKLNTNKKNNIENYCNNCTQEAFFNNYINEYTYKDILYIIDENDKFYKTKMALSKKTYLDMEIDSKILKDIDKPSDLQEKEILEFYGYKTDDYNEFTKHKLYNRITRSSELLEEFGDKILYLKVKPSFYSYIGKLQFLAFKDFLYKLLNINKIDNILKTTILSFD